MNEILAPIYYSFCDESHEYMKEHVESDSFFCFTIVMSDLIDNFLK
jgi:TBC1 domain family member 13